MAEGVIIRVEKPEDHHSVHLVVRDAFWNLYKEGCTEHLLTYKMRDLPEFIPELSLVATIDDNIVGYLGYHKSYITNEEDGKKFETLSFGPLAVAPTHHSKGIGKKLVEDSFSRATEMGFKAVVIQGYPTYYQRFGFVKCKEHNIRDEGGFSDGTQVRELQPGCLKGVDGLWSTVFDTVDLSDEAVDVFEKDQQFPPKPKGKTKSQEMFAMAVTTKAGDPYPDGFDVKFCGDTTILDV